MPRDRPARDATDNTTDGQFSTGGGGRAIPLKSDRVLTHNLSGGLDLRNYGGPIRLIGGINSTTPITDTGRTISSTSATDSTFGQVSYTYSGTTSKFMAPTWFVSATSPTTTTTAVITLTANVEGPVMSYRGFNGDVTVSTTGGSTYTDSFSNVTLPQSVSREVTTGGNITFSLYPQNAADLAVEYFNGTTTTTASVTGSADEYNTPSVGVSFNGQGVSWGFGFFSYGLNGRGQVNYTNASFTITTQT